MSIPPRQILGQTRERSKNNEEELGQLSVSHDELKARLDTVEMYAKSHAVFLAILGAQALGIPTQKLLTLLLSFL